MRTTWNAWIKSVPCKSHPEEGAGESKDRNFMGERSGCRRSFSNLKHVMQSGRREQAERRSGSVHGGALHFNNALKERCPNGDDTKRNLVERTRYGSTSRNFASEGRHHGNMLGCYGCSALDNQASFVISRGSLNTTSGFSTPYVTPVCSKCGEIFTTYGAMENHHLSQHAVTQLSTADSAHNIIEIIFRTGWLLIDQVNRLKIVRILKVHNMQRVVERFEEYREMVKLKASRGLKKHPRCIADGNELLRFYGTTLKCSLGGNGCSSLCAMGDCNVCYIIRSGFRIRRESGKGIHTTATSGKAHNSMNVIQDNHPHACSRAMVICRVIAGRVHKAHDNHEAVFPPTGFDSIVAVAEDEFASHSSMDELYVFNPKAILPCFVVIYKY